MVPLKILTLKRVTSAHKDGSYGVLFDEKDPFVITLERPWINNQVDVSCIPVGEYMCQRINSPKFGDTFEVINVPGRVNILFHKGNSVTDRHGCIILGSRFGKNVEQIVVEESAAAFAKFHEHLTGLKEFRLVIEQC